MDDEVYVVKGRKNWRESCSELFEKSKLEDPIHNSRKLCEIVLVE